MLSFDVWPGERGALPRALGETLLAVASTCDLSDHLRLDLRSAVAQQPPIGFLGIIVRTTKRGSPNASPTVIGYAQVSRGNQTDVAEIAVPPLSARHTTLKAEQLALELLDVMLTAQTTFHPNTDLTWWVDIDDSTQHLRDRAFDRGLFLDRELLRMGIAFEDDSEASPRPPTNRREDRTRSFDPATDVEALLRVNNRAFGDHPEQGGWTQATFQQRSEEPWFEPDGIRVLDQDGEMIGFCWTKMHPGPVGEIYAIAVDPDHAGRGFGRELVSAGLDHIRRAGANRAILYVDADNGSARGLYEHLGFRIEHARAAFVHRSDSTTES